MKSSFLFYRTVKMVSDVAFAADDGLDVLVIHGRFQKFGHSGHRSVVGDGQA